MQLPSMISASRPMYIGPLLTFRIAASALAPSSRNILGVPSGKHGSPITVQVELSFWLLALRVMVMKSSRRACSLSMNMSGSMFMARGASAISSDSAGVLATVGDGLALACHGLSRMEVLKHRHKLGGWANVAGYVVVVVTVGLDAGIFYREVFGRSIGVGAGKAFSHFWRMVSIPNRISDTGRVNVMGRKFSRVAVSSKRIMLRIVIDDGFKYMQT